MQTPLTLPSPLKGRGDLAPSPPEEEGEGDDWLA